MFKNIKQPRVSDQIVDQIHNLLLTRALKPGQRLPTETELADEFGVSRSTVREAFSVLEVQGVIERRKNGTFLRKYSLNRILDAVELPRKMDHELFADLIEARIHLELQVIDLACKRVEETDLLRMETAIQMMEDDLVAGRSGVEADIFFHQCLAVATKNQVLAGIGRSFGQMLKETRMKTLQAPGRLAECLKEHRQIYEAVKNHDTDTARILIQEHLKVVRNILLDMKPDTRSGEEWT